MHTRRARPRWPTRRLSADPLAAHHRARPVRLDLLLRGLRRLVRLQHERLRRGVREDPRQILGGEPAAAAGGRGRDDAVERSTSQSRWSAWVGVRPFSMRASTGTPAAARRARPPRAAASRPDLARSSASPARTRAGRGSGRRGRGSPLCAGDPDRRVEHGRVEAAAGERDEDARGPAAAALRRRPRGRRARRRGERRARRARRRGDHRLRSSGRARSATTRMSMPGSSRTIRESSEPPRISRRRDSSGVPTKT